MLKWLALIAIFLMSISFAFSLCEENQIDINTASLEELDKIAGIGPVYAQRIIEGRPFDSVNGLLEVNGIGEKTLEKIKAEELACVSSEESEEEKDTSAEENKTNETENSNITQSEAITNSIQNLSIPATSEITLNEINLNSKDIKSENNKENLKKNLALGGVAVFCVLFGGLFFLRFSRRKKNEFR